MPTIGDVYEPAMEIQTQAEADAYFEKLVGDTITNYGKSREEAERIIRENLGYYAGYYGNETRARVERLFRCEHPIFGSLEKNGSPTFEQALKAGMDYAEKRKKERTNHAKD